VNDIQKLIQHKEIEQMKSKH